MSHYYNILYTKIYFIVSSPIVCSAAATSRRLTAVAQHNNNIDIYICKYNDNNVRHNRTPTAGLTVSQESYMRDKVDPSGC